MAATNEIQAKVKEYATFISQTLQPQLQSAVDAREATEADISEYVRLRNKLQYLENTIKASVGGGAQSSINQCNPLEALVDVSHATVFCRAVIPNPRTVYVDVGLGFLVEFTLYEAIQFIDKRLKYLEEEVLEHRVSVASRIAKDVEDALDLLEELGAEIPGRN